MTHWANKAAQLGAEQSSEVVKEQKVVRWIRENEKGVLLKLSELSPTQRRLVG